MTEQDLEMAPDPDPKPDIPADNSQTVTAVTQASGDIDNTASATSATTAPW